MTSFELTFEVVKLSHILFNTVVMESGSYYNGVYITQ